MNAELHRLAAFAPLLERPGFDFGQWAGGERRPDGTITMPYFDFSPQALELLRAMPVRVGFDWGTWLATTEARELIDHPERIALATADQLVKLSTALKRSDRFTEGSLAGAFESGLLAALVRRAANLTRA